jgi:hypothetical protein
VAVPVVFIVDMGLRVSDRLVLAEGPPSLDADPSGWEAQAA